MKSAVFVYIFASAACLHICLQFQSTVCLHLGANDSSGVGSDLAKQWEVILRQALMPVTQGSSDAAVAGPKNNSHR